MIKPTVGRVVWYYPNGHQEGAEPLSAQVAKVWSDTCVNIGYLLESGSPANATSVLLYQGEGPRPTTPFCEWMPYQIGQAKKHEAPGT
jgi:hypothetical protein